MNKIRKGDEVIVLTGRDKGKRGTVLQRVDEDRMCRRGHQRGEEARQAEPDEGHDRRRRRQDDADPPVERRDFQRATGKADRVGIKVDWTTRQVRVFKSSGDEIKAERHGKQEYRNQWLVCKQFYREKIVPDLIEKFGYKSPMQVPRLTKITLNMGVSEAVADKKVMDNAVGDLTKIAGQKPVVTKSKKAIAGFKIREGHADRLHGHAARRADVRIPGPFRDRGAAARARLPRHLGSCVRRPWQLQHRRQRTDHFPRNRVRQDRRAAWAEHQHHHDGEDRRRVQGAARRFKFPFKN